MKLASETDLYERYPDLSRLAKALQRAKGDFALFFVECNVTTLRRELSHSLATRLQPLPIEVDLNTFGGDLQHIPLDELLVARVQDTPNDAVIFLFGLEQLLPTQSAERLRATVQQLNWRRSFFSQLKRPLVIWLPQYALNLLSEKTPDFYDWYSGVFVFPADKNTLQQAEQNTFQQISEQGIHSGNRSSITEKKQWLHTLRSLLEEHTTPDSIRSNLLVNIAYLHNSLGNYGQALNYYQEALAIQQEISDKSAEGTNLNNISQIYQVRGDYDTALDLLNKSLAIQQNIGDKFGEGNTLNNISQIYQIRGDYNTALDFLNKSFTIRQEIGDKSGESNTLNNMATNAYARGDYDTALDFLNKSHVIQQEIGDKSAEGTILNNISQIFNTRGDYDTALDLLNKSLAIQQEIGDKSGESTTFNNIAQILKARGDYDTALDFLNKSLAIQQETGNVTGLCTTLFNIGHIHLQNGKAAEAVQAWVAAYGLAKKMNLAQELEALENLAGNLGLKGGLQGWEMLAQQINKA
ncbi:MAG: tetratricopeptide repeat protein [Candidatus Thiothrix sulfatifontis]|nr:MAG: tetratricopeptide repeat protein [Candidatus Thiothrix sulfatifontis]